MVPGGRSWCLVRCVCVCCARAGVLVALCLPCARVCVAALVGFGAGFGLLVGRFGVGFPVPGPVSWFSSGFQLARHRGGLRDAPSDQI